MTRTVRAHSDQRELLPPGPQPGARLDVRVPQAVCGAPAGLACNWGAGFALPVHTTQVTLALCVKVGVPSAPSTHPSQNLEGSVLNCPRDTPAKQLLWCPVLPQLRWSELPQYWCPRVPQKKINLANATSARSWS